MAMQIQAKLDGGDWQLPLNRQETEAVLENIAAVVKLCEALGIEAVLIGPRFVIRVSDMEVGRWDHALSGVVWAALDPVGRWGSGARGGDLPRALLSMLGCRRRRA
jgi:hypothetical protein